MEQEYGFPQCFWITHSLESLPFNILLHILFHSFHSMHVLWNGVCVCVSFYVWDFFVLVQLLDIRIQIYRLWRATEICKRFIPVIFHSTWFYNIQLENRCYSISFFFLLYKHEFVWVFTFICMLFCSYKILYARAALNRILVGLNFFFLSFFGSFLSCFI